MKELLSLIMFMAGSVLSPAALAAPAAAPEDVVGAHQSANWAGYAAEGGGFSAIGATWTVPRATSPEDAATHVAWIGIGGVHTRDLIQAGTQSWIEDGVEGYRAWYELLPEYQQELPLEVSAGDTVRVSLTEISPNLWHLLFVNTTTGESLAKLLPYDSSHSSAEWVLERPLIGVDGGPFSYIPLDEFGEVGFTDAYAVQDGRRLNLMETGAEPIHMMTRTREKLATPSVMGADAASFTVAREARSMNPYFSIVPERRYLMLINSDGTTEIYAY